MHRALRKIGAEKMVPLGILLVLLSIFFRISSITAGVRHALDICVSSIIPTLFPFMILTEAMLHTEAGMRALTLLARPLSYLFGVSREGAVGYLVGIFFGFPLGIETVSTLFSDGRISKSEAERLLLFCNNSGPSFAVGVIGIGFFGSARAGLLLYAVQLAASLLIGLSFRFFGKKVSQNEGVLRPVNDFHLTDSIQKAVRQTMTVCGCVLFFSAVLALCEPFLPSPVSRALLSALLEVGGATAYVAEHLSYPLSLPLCGFALSFSGLSVYLQARALLRDTSISTRYYLPVKLLTGGLSFFLLLLLSCVDIGAALC